jgi:hypothetical protein
MRLLWRSLWGFFFWVFPRYNSTAAMKHRSSIGFVLPMQTMKVFRNIGESPGQLGKVCSYTCARR